MTRRHYLAAGATMAASLIWAALLVFFPGSWSAPAALVVGCGMLLTASVAVAGILLQSSRLGYWLAVSVVTQQAVIALRQSLSPLWWVGVGVMVVAAVALADPSLGGQVRTQPHPAPLPRTAVALCLLLLAAGPLAALVAPTTPTAALTVLAFTAWLILFAYVRLLPGREWWPRLGAPVLAAAAFFLPSPSRWVWLTVLAAASWLAWTRGSRLAVRPLIESGHAVPIPPELVPSEVLGAAGLDRRGRRLKEGK
ncbi:MAG TPA: hypothetical protein VJR05_07785 [Acidimicrobiia bacterium]|nr:hypothetical protein [Acidimicrobiia bacterium]